MNKKQIITITVITIIIMFILLVIFMIYRNSNNNNNLVSSPSVLNNTSFPTTSSQDKKYTSTDGTFEYTYPMSWKFRPGRDGIGLYPSNDFNYQDGNREIITIFSAPANNQSPEDWSKAFDGYGDNYKNARSININGNNAFTMTYESSYKQIFYIIKHKDLIIHITFRVIDNSKDIEIDNSKYLNDFESIVNSIKFLN